MYIKGTLLAIVNEASKNRCCKQLSDVIISGLIALLNSRHLSCDLASPLPVMLRVTQYFLVNLLFQVFRILSSLSD